MINAKLISLSINGKKITQDSEEPQSVSSGVIECAIETYDSSNGISINEYAIDLQRIRDEYRAEQELERIRALMKGRWYE